MSVNPFEDPGGTYHVLVNDEGQHSLWPTFAELPAGWSVALAAADRQTALDYVTTHWTDMRPTSLVEAAREDAVVRLLPDAKIREEKDGGQATVGPGGGSHLQRAHEPAADCGPAA